MLKPTPTTHKSQKSRRTTKNTQQIQKSRPSKTDPLRKRNTDHRDLTPILSADYSADFIESLMAQKVKPDLSSAAFPYSIPELNFFPNMRKSLIEIFINKSSEEYCQSGDFVKKCISLILRKQFSAGRPDPSGKNPGPIAPLSGQTVQELAKKPGSNRNFGVSKYLLDSFIGFELDQTLKRSFPNIQLTKREAFAFKVKFLKQCFRQKTQTKLGTLAVVSTFFKVNPKTPIMSELCSRELIEKLSLNRKPHRQLELIQSEPLVLEKCLRFLKVRENARARDWLKSELVRSIYIFVKSMVLDFSSKCQRSEDKYLMHLRKKLNRSNTKLPV